MHWGNIKGASAGPWRRLCASAAALALGACTTYQPRPIAPAQARAALESRRLETRESYDQAQLLQAAARYNPSLAEARGRLAEAAAAVQTAKAWPNPVLNLGFEYDVRRAAEAPWLWAVAPSFLLDTALARRLRREIATGGLRAAQLDYVEAVWAVRRELRAALLAAVIGERRRAQLGAIVDDRSELLRLLEARVAAGESGSGERLQSALELTRARAAMADAQRAVADARARMAGVIGVPPSALDDQALRWEDLDAPQLPDAAQLRRQREQALLSRTDLARAIVDYDTRERELHEQVRLQYPQFSAGPGYMYDHGIRKATASVSFNLPLFNHNQGPIAEADARRESAGRHLLAVQAQILNEVDSSWNAYRSALEALSAATEQTMSAQRLLQQTQRSFDLGAEDRATLLAARLTQAAQSLLQLDALERAQQALGQLEDALRTPLYGPELHLDNPRGDNLQ